MSLQAVIAAATASAASSDILRSGEFRISLTIFMTAYLSAPPYPVIEDFISVGAYSKIGIPDSSAHKRRTPLASAT